MKSRTILEILDQVTGFLKSKKIKNSRLNAEQIISHVLKIKIFDLYLIDDNVVSIEDKKQIENFMLRRATYEPLQYILGETNFYGNKMLVNRTVLIPRPETEYLVEKIIKENPGANSILDIGTGSGAIAIALAKEKNPAIIDAIDISDAALEIAKKNSEINKVNINFFQSDVFSNVYRKYDIIVSNPPYIPEDEFEKLPIEIKYFEPRMALVANKTGLFFYKKILGKASNFLNEKGKIYFEIGYNNGEKIKKLAEKSGFTNIEIKKDLNDFDRIIKIGK